MLGLTQRVSYVPASGMNADAQDAQDVCRQCDPQRVVMELCIDFSTATHTAIVSVCPCPQLVVEELKIASQNDTAKLAEAKQRVYLKVCRSGS